MHLSPVLGIYPVPIWESGGLKPLMAMTPAGQCSAVVPWFPRRDAEDEKSPATAHTAQLRTLLAALVSDARAKPAACLLLGSFDE